MNDDNDLWDDLGFFTAAQEFVAAENVMIKLAKQVVRYNIDCMLDDGKFNHEFFLDSLIENQSFRNSLGFLITSMRFNAHEDKEAFDRAQELGE